MYTDKNEDNVQQKPIVPLSQQDKGKDTIPTSEMWPVSQSTYRQAEILAI